MDNADPVQPCRHTAVYHNQASRPQSCRTSHKVPEPKAPQSPCAKCRAAATLHLPVLSELPSTPAAAQRQFGCPLAARARSALLVLPLLLLGGCARVLYGPASVTSSTIL